MSEYQPTPLLNKKPTLVMLWPPIFSTLSLLLLYSIYSLQAYLNVLEHNITVLKSGNKNQIIQQLS